MMAPGRGSNASARLRKAQKPCMKSPTHAAAPLRMRAHALVRASLPAAANLLELHIDLHAVLHLEHLRPARTQERER